MPAAYDRADVLALKALAAGVANEGQQRRALDWIVNRAAQTYDLSYRSDADGGDRETAFAEGRRFVGLSAVKLINMPAMMLDAMEKETR